MEAATFEHCGEVFTVTAPIKLAFRKYGFILVKKLFTQVEMDLLWACFDTQEFKQNMFTRSNGGEKGFQMALWWQPGDDTAGLVSRSERVAGTMRDLLGDEAQELYLLSSKVIAKEPEEGGAFAWHQDYGYFYENGVLFPDCGSVSLALHPCHRENGCLQVIPRSHQMGRLSHQRTGDLASVDPERMEAVIRVLGEPVMVETSPGDVLFFHSNLLHTSGPNISKDRRWNLVLAYNQVCNAPFHNKFLQQPSKLNIVANDDVVRKHSVISSTPKNFINTKEDNSTEKLQK